ncbi:hypothetical protein FCOIX_5829 [Fusarium coicis]|nr:hypothetical protein FCOIX_5829 [Fusarium coicis]
MLSIKSLVLSCLLLGAVQSEEAKDLSKHNCCLHIKNASDAWWLTNPDVTKEVCESYYKDIAQFDSKTGTCDEHKNGTINDADWKSKCDEGFRRAHVSGLHTADREMTVLVARNGGVDKPCITAGLWVEDLARSSQPSMMVSREKGWSRSASAHEMGKLEIVTGLPYEDPGSYTSRLY